jgi:hypothetical protein
VRPGREHDTTCARARPDLLPALTATQRTVNTLHSRPAPWLNAENSLLTTTFKALRRAGLCPWRISAITASARVCSNDCTPTAPSGRRQRRIGYVDVGRPKESDDDHIVSRDTPSRSAIAEFEPPSVAASTIRLRNADPAAPTTPTASVRHQ